MEPTLLTLELRSFMSLYQLVTYLITSLKALYGDPGSLSGALDQSSKSCGDPAKFAAAALGWCCDSGNPAAA